MKAKSKESDKHVDAVLRATQILECFETFSRLSLNDIHEKTGINKSRILRIAGTLESAGFLIRDLGTSFYQLGPRMMALGNTITRNNLETTSIVRPYLKKLVKESGETATFYFLQGSSRFCLAREDGPGSVLFITKEGEEKPLYAGAAGKAILAFLKGEDREKILSGRFESDINSYSLSSLENMRKELEVIAERGYAVSFEETSPGAAGISVPIFQSGDQLVGSVAIAAPVTRVSEEKLENWKELLLDVSLELSRKMGYTG
jgi:DNA-binding IclR family transcriptional regulator